MNRKKKKVLAKRRTSKKKVEKSSTPSIHFNKKNDIIHLIMEDHKPLKRLIQIMKNAEKTVSARRQAFSEFAPLLMSHAKPEEQILYSFMKRNADMRLDGLEGDVEHQLADQMIAEIKKTDDEDLWEAKVKVLAELVEHHIEEEEEEMLPDFKKHFMEEHRQSLGRDFIEAKSLITTQSLKREKFQVPATIETFAH